MAALTAADAFTAGVDPGDVEPDAHRELARIRSARAGGSLGTAGGPTPGGPTSA